MVFSFVAATSREKDLAKLLYRTGHAAKLTFFRVCHHFSQDKKHAMRRATSGGARHHSTLPHIRPRSTLSLQRQRTSPSCSKPTRQTMSDQNNQTVESLCLPGTIWGNRHQQPTGTKTLRHTRINVAEKLCFYEITKQKSRRAGRTYSKTTAVCAEHESLCHRRSLPPGVQGAFQRAIS